MGRTVRESSAEMASHQESASSCAVVMQAKCNRMLLLASCYRLQVTGYPQTRQPNTTRTTSPFLWVLEPYRYWVTSFVSHRAWKSFSWTVLAQGLSGQMLALAVVSEDLTGWRTHFQPHQWLLAGSPAIWAAPRSCSRHGNWFPQRK